MNEKMDGENTSLYRDGLHARSIDGRHHPSRDWVKAMHGRMAHLIPEGWRVCGENLYALHSVGYADLPSFFLIKEDLEGISLARRAALILGAALHDIAKPVTTREREIDGRIRLVCPRHEQQGRSYLAVQLAGALGFPLLDSVMALTGYHNALKMLVVRDQSPGAYRKLSRLVDLELIYWLEIADIRGRECVDKAKQLEHLDIFRMFAGNTTYGSGRPKTTGARTSVRRCPAIRARPSIS